MALLTLGEMKKIILGKNGSVAYNGRVISRTNIHELPSEAEWALAAGQNLDVVEAELQKQRASLDAQIKQINFAKAEQALKPEVPKDEPKTAKKADKTVKNTVEEEFPEVISSKPTV